MTWIPDPMRALRASGSASKSLTFCTLFSFRRSTTVVGFSLWNDKVPQFTPMADSAFRDEFISMREIKAATLNLGNDNIFVWKRSLLLGSKKHKNKNHSVIHTHTLEFLSESELFPLPTKKGKKKKTPFCLCLLLVGEMRMSLWEWMRKWAELLWKKLCQCLTVYGRVKFKLPFRDLYYHYEFYFNFIMMYSCTVNSNEMTRIPILQS